MAGEPKGTPGAPSTPVAKWNAINWPKLRKDVLRLQMRIAKATKQKRWGKVKSLQHILVTSRSAKLLAVKKVTSNKGKSTPGIDGIIWKSVTAKFRAVEDLVRRGYKAKPLRRVYIPKPNGKMRPLGIPTMKDRAMQALYAMSLEPVAETNADAHSYGFRPRRCVADAIGQCFNILAQKGCATWILEGDIKACFDQIDHQWMLEHIPMDKLVLRQWLKAGYLDNNVLHHTTAGTPQGGIASPILANMALDGLQQAIAQATPKGAKTHFVRYADDFVCTGTNSEVLRDIVMPTIQAFLRERGLHLSPEKTLITHIDEGFDFLGFNIRKYSGKLLIKPAKEKVKLFIRGLKGCSKALRYRKAHVVISTLNRKLMGWANFYRSVVAKQTFGRIDHSLFEAIWRELRRRHPRKTSRWVKEVYFTCKNHNNWTFSGLESRSDKERTHFLYRLSSCEIRRHVKVRSQATPYDRSYSTYFKRRAAKSIARRERERYKTTLTRTRWLKRHPDQLELFPAGLRKQP